MARKVLQTTLAFIGLVVGAGFASGQEVLQYFVSYGTGGIVAAAISAILLALAGVAILQLGSYYHAMEHTDVFDSITRPWISRLVDAFVCLVLFCLGFVMIAGAGSNLHQQFGLPNWVGAVVVTVLVILTGMLDVNKVMTIIGSITPFIIVFTVAASLHAFISANPDWEALSNVALSVPSPLPNWPVAVLNYVGLALILALSMALVMGGDQLNARIAGLGGLFGGATFGLLLFIASCAIFVSVDSVKDADMPMLAMVNDISPVLGTIMAIVIFGMIYNTAIGMFYALGKRAAGIRSSWYKPALIGTTLAGFACSFLGFKTLVGKLYPIIGWVGIVIIAMIVIRWVLDRKQIQKETARRVRIRDLVTDKLHRRRRFTARDHKRLEKELAASNLADHTLHGDMVDEVASELDAAGEPVDARVVATTQAEVEAIDELIDEHGEEAVLDDTGTLLPTHEGVVEDAVEEAVARGEDSPEHSHHP
ncbi:MAG: hypothetical protein Q4B10_01455 [Actinomycetaceae bacterium]|nr:hypothetical protein [Actinomycetaceae bacterium]